MSDPMFSGKRFSAFLFVGLMGFGVDLAAFILLQLVFREPLVARIGASSIAILATWILNRRLTFGKVDFSGAGPELVKYVLTSALGASANFAAFAIAYHLYPSLPLAYVCGTGSGLFVNYVGYNRFVYSK